MYTGRVCRKLRVIEFILQCICTRNCGKIKTQCTIWNNYDYYGVHTSSGHYCFMRFLLSYIYKKKNVPIHLLCYCRRYRYNIFIMLLLLYCYYILSSFAETFFASSYRYLLTEIRLSLGQKLERAASIIIYYTI